MSFTAFDRPLVGQVARCKRCRVTYVAKSCGCPLNDCGVKMWPAGYEESGVTVEVGARLVADRTCEFCPNCWTVDERAALALKETAQQRGTSGN